MSYTVRLWHADIRSTDVLLLREAQLKRRLLRSLRRYRSRAVRFRFLHRHSTSDMTETFVSPRILNQALPTYLRQRIERRVSRTTRGVTVFDRYRLRNTIPQYTSTNPSDKRLSKMSMFYALACSYGSASFARRCYSRFGNKRFREITGPTGSSVSASLYFRLSPLIIHMFQ